MCVCGGREEHRRRGWELGEEGRGLRGKGVERVDGGGGTRGGG